MSRGIFRFVAWDNGTLRNCALIQKKGEKGKFVTNGDGDYLAVLDDFRKGYVRQDNDGRLYFIGNENR